MTSVDERLNADGFTARKHAFNPQMTSTGLLATDNASTSDTPAADRLIGGDPMHNDIPTLNARGVDAAIATHQDVARIYEQAWNAHTFDFERDLGHFMAPDITIISGGTLGGRALLRETSDARADYVRGTQATVTINSEITYVADIDTTVVVVAEGELSFTYPDRTTYTQRLLISSTLRLLDDEWVFQHVHFGRGCL